MYILHVIHVMLLQCIFWSLQSGWVVIIKWLILIRGRTFSSMRKAFGVQTLRLWFLLAVLISHPPYLKVLNWYWTQATSFNYVNISWYFIHAQLSLLGCVSCFTEISRVWAENVLKGFEPACKEPQAILETVCVLCLLVLSWIMRQNIWQLNPTAAAEVIGVEHFTEKLQFSLAMWTGYLLICSESCWGVNSVISSNNNPQLKSALCLNNWYKREFW